ncbi:MAG: TolC family protein [Myxococcales bacterium]|nr:TolC family protein [Myxococcales bacterium]
MRGKLPISSALAILELAGLFVPNVLWAEASPAIEVRAPAEPPALPAMTLVDALAYARANQPSLKAAQARIEVAKRAAWGVRSEWLPQVGAGAQLFYGTMNNSTAMFLGMRTVDIPRIGGSRSDGSWGDAYPSTVVALGLRQNIYDFGRLAALAMAGDAEVAASAHRLRLESLDVALTVESTFYGVLAAKAVERAAEDAYKRAVLRRDMVKASVDRGLRPTIDLTRAEADLTRFFVGCMRARGGIEAAQALWAAAVGVPDPLLDTLVGREGSEENLDAAQAPLPTLGEAFEQALSRDPSVRLALSRLAAQQALTRATVRQWAPSLSLTAGVNGRAGGAPQSSGPSGQSGWLPATPNWDLGLILQVPIFDGVLLARQRQSQAQEDVLRHEVDAARRRLLADIQRAYTAFRVAESALPALRTSALAAQKNYEQASTRFRADLGSSVELAGAETLLTDAEIQLAIGRFDVSRARAALHRSIALGL